MTKFPRCCADCCTKHVPVIDGEYAEYSNWKNWLLRVPGCDSSVTHGPVNENSWQRQSVCVCGKRKYGVVRHRVKRTCGVCDTHGMSGTRPLTLQSTNIQDTANAAQIRKSRVYVHQQCIRNACWHDQLIFSSSIEVQILTKY